MNRVSLCMIDIWNIVTLQDAKDAVASLGTIATKTVNITNRYSRRKRMKAVSAKMNEVRMHCIANGWQDALTQLQQHFEVIIEENNNEEKISSLMWEISKQ